MIEINVCRSAFSKCLKCGADDILDQKEHLENCEGIMKNTEQSTEKSEAAGQMCQIACSDEEEMNDDN